MNNSDNQINKKKLDIPVTKKEIFGWIMFDFANSSYTTVIITILYSSFFTNYIIGDKYNHMRNTIWGILIVISTIIAMFLSPYLGTVCDYSGKKKRYLVISTLICSISTMLLFFINPGDLFLGGLLIIISNTAFMMTENLCASFLPELSNKKNIAIVSGLGWGFGYIGGLITIYIAQIIILKSNVNTNYTAFVMENKQVALFIGLFFLISAIPTMLLIKKRNLPVRGYETAKTSVYIRMAWLEMKSITNIAKTNKLLMKFFIAFTIYYAGVDILFKFFGIYKNTLELTTDQSILMFILIQFSAVIGSVVFGYLEKFINSKNTVLLSILWWIMGVIMIIYLNKISEFFHYPASNLFMIVSIIVGAGMGSLQSSSRTLVGLLCPPDREAQIFGFWGFFMRLGTILAMSFGPFSDLVGINKGLWLVVIFFAIGGIFLYFIPIEKYLQLKITEKK